MPGKPGRPVEANPHNKVISVRLTDDEYRLVKEAAERFDLPLSVWTRARLVAAAKRATA